MIENPYAPPTSAELARLDADRDAISFGRAVLMVLALSALDKDVPPGTKVR